PELGDAVVNRLTLSISFDQGVGLHVSSDAGQLDDDVGMRRTPVRLERLHGHAGFALEERQGFDHEQRWAAAQFDLPRSAHCLRAPAAACFTSGSASEAATSSARRASSL